MNKKVLLIDDDDQYVYLTQRMLRKIDNTVELKRCVNGQEGLIYIEDYFNNKAAEQDPVLDLVLVDINMPVMNGFEFLEALTEFIEKNNHKIPPPKIMMVTSSELKTDIELASKYRINQKFLTKPLKKEELEEALKLVV